MTHQREQLLGDVATTPTFRTTRRCCRRRQSSSGGTST